MADGFTIVTNKQSRDRNPRREPTVSLVRKQHKPNGRPDVNKDSATSEDQGGEDVGMAFGLRNSPCSIQNLPLPRHKATYEQGGTYHSVYDQGDNKRLHTGHYDCERKTRECSWQSKTGI